MKPRATKQSLTSRITKNMTVSFVCQKNYVRFSIKPFPVQQKTVTILDINNPKTITSMAQQPISLPSEDGLTLVTVGRLVPQKGYDIAAKAAWLLKKRGVRFRWYVVGGGDSEPIERILRSMGSETVLRCWARRQIPTPI